MGGQVGSNNPSHYQLVSLQLFSGYFHQHFLAQPMDCSLSCFMSMAVMKVWFCMRRMTVERRGARVNSSQRTSIGVAALMKHWLLFRWLICILPGLCQTQEHLSIQRATRDNIG